MENNKIVKQVEMKASPGKVWKALTDHQQFSAWFGVKLEGPFVTGQKARGHLTYPGYEHLVLEAQVKEIKPETYFAFTWHPYAVDTKVDYSKETPTLVEFKLEPAGAGTRLTVTESGFDKVPAHRRAEAFRMNEGGWQEQMENIAKYVSG